MAWLDSLCHVGKEQQRDICQPLERSSCLGGRWYVLDERAILRGALKSNPGVSGTKKAHLVSGGSVRFLLVSIVHIVAVS